MNYLTDTLTTGTIAGVATTAAAALEGAVADGSPLGPINAVSHILWGDQAARRDRASVKYTLNGLALNLAAVTSWAAVHEACFSRFARRGDVLGSLAGGAAVSALAYVTDYRVVPRRFTPGFEMRLPGSALCRIYTVLALGLGLGSLLAHKLDNRRTAR